MLSRVYNSLFKAKERFFPFPPIFFVDPESSSVVVPTKRGIISILEAFRSSFYDIIARNKDTLNRNFEDTKTELFTKKLALIEQKKIKDWNSSIPFRLLLYYWNGLLT